MRSSGAGYVCRALLAPISPSHGKNLIATHLSARYLPRRSAYLAIACGCEVSPPARKESPPRGDQLQLRYPRLSPPDCLRSYCEGKQSPSADTSLGRLVLGAPPRSEPRIAPSLLFFWGRSLRPRAPAPAPVNLVVTFTPSFVAVTARSGHRRADLGMEYMDRLIDNGRLAARTRASPLSRSITSIKHGSLANTLRNMMLWNSDPGRRFRGS
ncbi:hypothetical protein FB451DRAFT_1485098 [Mycena latifolia]|nr:hypothetical protein FB451DRAFT_1485098 [Mycena latifolia]